MIQYMLQINLLPPHEKRALQMEETTRIARFLGLVTVVILAFGTAGILPSFISTHIVRRELLRSFEFEEQVLKRHSGVQQTVSQAKQTEESLGEIEEYLAAPPHIWLLLERFFTPGKGVTITSFLVRKDGEVALSGRAETRNDLLNFEESLRTSNRFHEIAFPLRNIVRERNIQFTVEGKLKPEYGL